MFCFWNQTQGVTVARGISNFNFSPSTVQSWATFGFGFFSDVSDRIFFQSKHNPRKSVRNVAKKSLSGTFRLIGVVSGTGGNDFCRLSAPSPKSPLFALMPPK
jgi:hypothetical protein